MSTLKNLEAKLDTAEFRVKFWGVRGSTTITEQSVIRGVGGYTTCIQIDVGGETLLIDAGTGLRNFGKWFLSQPQTASDPQHLHMFATHPHDDHWLGLQFFAPIYARRNLTIDVTGHESWKRLFEQNIFDGVTFPVTTKMLAATTEFHTAVHGSILVIPTETGHNIIVEPRLVKHPGGCFGYRFTYRGKSVVVIMDHEEAHTDSVNAASELELEDNLVELCRDADLVIIECQYHSVAAVSIARYVKGWGHERAEHLVEILRTARVRNVVLTHHDPDATPTVVRFISKIVGDGAKIPTAYAREGMELFV